MKESAYTEARAKTPMKLICYGAFYWRMIAPPCK